MADLTTLHGLLRRLRFTIRAATRHPASHHDADRYQAVGGVYEYRSVAGTRRMIHVRQGRTADGRWAPVYEWARVGRSGRIGPYRRL
jgi:hypothetical protein